jgi:Cupin
MRRLMSLNVFYMLRRLKLGSTYARHRLAQPTFRNDAGARPAQFALLLCRAWRIHRGPSETSEIPYHAVVGGSAVLEDPAGRRPLQLKVGDILLLPGNPRHVLHDGSGAPLVPARNRPTLNLTISENPGTGERLDLLCGHFVIAPPHDRMLRNDLPPLLVVHAGDLNVETVRSRTDAQLTGLVALMRSESAADHLGGRAILNALSTAMFALVLRLASEADDAPVGLLALAGHPPSGPGADGAIQRTGAGLVAAGARPSLQHVARDAGAPVPGEARTIGE